VFSDSVAFYQYSGGQVIRFINEAIDTIFEEVKTVPELHRLFSVAPIMFEHFDDPLHPYFDPAQPNRGAGAVVLPHHALLTNHHVQTAMAALYTHLIERRGMVMPRNANLFEDDVRTRLGRLLTHLNKDAFEPQSVYHEYCGYMPEHRGEMLQMIGFR
jgi:hypothetical protein